MSLLKNLCFAAQGMLDAYGGDTPDWLRAEATALEKAVKAAEVERYFERKE